MTPTTVTLNGESVVLGDITPHTTALDWIRAQGLTGCKEGCAEGECGACSVLVARPSPTDAGRSEWVAINACLVPVAALDGQEIVTAEGLGTPSELHPVQREVALRGGSQCGYCTPGFVCSMAAEYYRVDRVPDATCSAEHGPNGFDLHALAGNLCRCTGYRPLRDAAYALGSPLPDDTLAGRLERAAPPPASTELRADGARFHRPRDLASALALLADPDATVVAGSTDLGVEVNLRGRRPGLLIAIDRLPELRSFSFGDTEIRIGAALTLSEVERLLAGRVPLLDDLFPQFASRLIRNGATLGGNLGTGSPIGDAAPVLLALAASLVLTGPDGDRVVPLDSYFTGYRASVRRADELIREIRIPLPLPGLTGFHKIAKRRFDDISSVAVAMAFDVADGLVTVARIGLGGVAATPIRATAAEAALLGASWDAASIARAAALLSSAGTPLDDHRASARYRSAMLGSALRKFHGTTPEVVGS